MKLWVKGIIKNQKHTDNIFSESHTNLMADRKLHATCVSHGTVITSYAYGINTKQVNTIV